MNKLKYVFQSQRLCTVFYNKKKQQRLYVVLSYTKSVEGVSAGFVRSHRNSEWILFVLLGRFVLFGHFIYIFPLFSGPHRFYQFCICMSFLYATQEFYVTFSLQLFSFPLHRFSCMLHSAWKNISIGRVPLQQLVRCGYGLDV